MLHIKIAREKSGFYQRKYITNNARGETTYQLLFNLTSKKNIFDCEEHDGNCR